MIRLHDDEICPECYKPRLLLAMLGVAYERVNVPSPPAAEQGSAWLRAINPFATLPVLQDGDLSLADAQAILVYLARRHDAAQRWYPLGDAAALGRVSQFLGVAQDLSRTALAARRHDTLLVPTDIAAARHGAHRLMRVIDEHLWFAEQEGQDFLCAEHPTIADIACFPALMLCEEGGISRLPYPAIRRWTDRVKRISGFLAMPGI
jgi:glutathione S-transferase